MTTKAKTIAEVELTYTKETARTFVFSTDEESAALRSVYVGKDAFGGEAPAAITVSITL